MFERIDKKALIKQLASRMDTDESTAASWLDAILENLYENFKQGKSVTLQGFGSFYVKPKTPTWVFKFNPGQKLRAMLGWSSTYKGKI